LGSELAETETDLYQELEWQLILKKMNQYEIVLSTTTYWGVNAKILARSYPQL